LSLPILFFAFLASLRDFVNKIAQRRHPSDGRKEENYDIIS